MKCVNLKRKKKKDTKEITEVKETEEVTVPTEHKSALKKAELYSDSMNMSKAGIYDQLTSEYGEKFSDLL